MASASSRLCAADGCTKDCWQHHRLCAAHYFRLRRHNSLDYPRPKLKTHCIRGHEYTPENTYQRADGTGRECRKCGAIRHAYYTSDAYILGNG